MDSITRQIVMDQNAARTPDPIQGLDNNHDHWPVDLTADQWRQVLQNWALWTDETQETHDRISKHLRGHLFEEQRTAVLGGVLQSVFGTSAKTNEVLAVMRFAGWEFVKVPTG
jgi:alpha-L-arabinofuranosidase